MSMTDQITQKQRSVDVRQLHDLANILSNITNEEWNNPSERAAIIKGLATWPSVLRRIAASIKAS